jgi:hypothetical protein
MMLDIENLQMLPAEQQEIHQHGILIATSCLKGCDPALSKTRMG